MSNPPLVTIHSEVREQRAPQIPKRIGKAIGDEMRLSRDVPKWKEPDFSIGNVSFVPLIIDVRGSILGE